MNVYEVGALKKPAKATVEIPGSKSYTNRALVMAALTKGSVSLANPLYSEDTEAMLGCLKALGIHIETFADKIIVHGDLSDIQNGSFELYANDSGTTIRFLLALLCLAPGTKLLKGSTRLNERPIKDLVDALKCLGAKIDYLEKEGQSPLQIHPSSLCSANSITIDASMSSQFYSALLMIAPMLKGLKIHSREVIISRPYVDMTIDAMRQWGIDVLQMEDGSYHVQSGQHYKKDLYTIEGDYSSAGYFFAAAVLTQSTISLKNLNPDSLQADRKFLDILSSMGNEIKIDDDVITITGKQILPHSIDMEDCPDQVQTMAVLAAFAKGTTVISGVRSLRLKETERVLALKTELAKMDIKTEDTHDTLTIYGGNPRAATIDTYEDHRMAMAFAVAGTKLSGMKINNPEVVNKTFPGFWKQLESL